MQHLEVSCAVRRFFKSLGFKGLIYSQFMTHGQKNIKWHYTFIIRIVCYRNSLSTLNGAKFCARELSKHNYSKTCLKRTPYIPETWTNGK